MLEFAGEGVAAMPLDERATLTNMAVEAGGFTGIIEADEVVVDYLVKQRGLDADDVRAAHRAGDPARRTSATFEIDLGDDRADGRDARRSAQRRSARRARRPGGDVKIDIAYGGSCTGGKKADMDMYADGPRGARSSRASASPTACTSTSSSARRTSAATPRRRATSRSSRRRAPSSSIRRAARASRPGPGVSDSPEQVTVSAINRNFPGRSGPGKVYLASPLVVAASAIAGRIVGTGRDLTSPARFGSMRSVRLAAAIASASALAVAVACGSFGEEDPVPSSDGGEEAAVEAATDAPLDVAAVDAAMYPLCPPPAFNGACIANLPACPQRKLAEQTLEAFVFDIATDRSSVYWVDQIAGGMLQDPYNGEGQGRIHRIAKGGGPEALIARAQNQPRAITVDDTYVYWPTRNKATSTTTLWRLRKDAPACDPTCADPESIGTHVGGDIARLAHNGTVLLAQDMAGGRVLRHTGAAFVEILASSDLPNFAATRDYVFAGAPQTSVVGRASLVVNDRRDGWYLLPDAGPTVAPGAVQLASDCTSVYVLRDNETLRRVPVGDAATFGAGAIPGVVGATRAAADTRYLWISTYNAGGIYAYNRNSGTTTKVASGNFWTVAVDDDGVYFGEHAQGLHGALFVLDKTQ